MKIVRVTVASVQSLLIDTQANLERVEAACRTGHADGARIVFLPELMLTGHGGHPKMMENAQQVPDGPLSQAILQLSRELDLCVCVGIAERTGDNIYNSQMVADRGRYLGLQRKIYLSMDEYHYFAPGQKLATFDLGEIRFGIIVCYDNCFPEIALAHALNGVDLILSPHAGRTGIWPDDPPPEFCAEVIQGQQDLWEKRHRARAEDHNVFMLCNNAVGPSTSGLADLADYDKDYTTGVDPRHVVANHAGSVMGFDPAGEVFLRTAVTGFVDEVVTVDLDLSKRIAHHRPTQNRQPQLLLRMIQESVSS